MKPDDFEQRLQRQALRPIPAEWREGILTAAESAASTCHPPRAGRSPWLSILHDQLSAILWPNPQAWAGLAAVWILIFAVDFSLRDKTPVAAGRSAPPSQEVVAEMKQQQRMLAELIGARDEHAADRSKSLAPQPRSERAEIGVM